MYLKLFLIYSKSSKMLFYFLFGNILGQMVEKTKDCYKVFAYLTAFTTVIENNN